MPGGINVIDHIMPRLGQNLDRRQLAVNVSSHRLTRGERLLV